jgi:hypothetical protein
MDHLLFDTSTRLFEHVEGYYGRALFIALRPLCFTVIFSYFFLFLLFFLHAIVGNLSCRKPRPTEMKFGR